MTTCDVEGCDNKHFGHGYCSKHYKRWRNHGDPLGGRAFDGSGSGVCSINDGDCKHQRRLRRGMCPVHYDRWLVDPSRDVTKRMKAKPGEGYIDQQGYRKITLPDGTQRGEHRYVMTQALGRELYDHENVHHINGDRSDNRIENLELWSTSQPAGQRIEDKIAWAKDLLRQYGHIVLSHSNTPTSREVPAV